MEVLVSNSPKSETLKSENNFDIISNKNNNFKISLKNYTTYIQVEAKYDNPNKLLKKDYEKAFNLNELKNNKFLINY